ncbi:MAG: aromatic ring-hydroxylating dioxygenase subunit alpha [Gammaproteobacteria bacterium]|nr:aromatic ring-hydroxylating dioxygenase subunit alpha [Gammaproteobacteria bacterium]
MYINFWYPIALSDEVKNDEPLQVQILGLPFVAFRDTDGNPHVLSDTCVHRGGSLGKGWVRDGCVVCPYHGWEFGGDGKCTKIPTIAEDQHAPPRAKVDSYPTHEKYGILFAFLGDLPEEERPPLYEIEAFDADGWRANDIVTFEVGAYYERSVENGLDAAHNEFVHPAQGSPSIRESIQREDIKVEDESAWGSGFMMRYSGYASQGTRTLGEGVGGTRAGSSHHGPNTLITRIRFTEDKAFEQVFFEAPIDESRTRIFFVNMRCFMLEPENDQRLIDINMNIAHEDIRVIEALNPIRTPDTTTKEVLLPQDKPVVRYRQFLQEFEDRGWRIDQKTHRAQRGDIAFAIPSPDRRTSKNWVLEEVPLMPANEKAAAAKTRAG